MKVEKPLLDLIVDKFYDEIIFNADVADEDEAVCIFEQITGEEYEIR